MLSHDILRGIILFLTFDDVTITLKNQQMLSFVGGKKFGLHNK